MRDIYYQSVGNPLQLDRLPASQPETDMLAPAQKPSARLSQLAATLATAAGVALASMVVYRVAGVNWLRPYDLIFSIPVVLGGIVAAAATRQVCWLLHPVFLIGVGLLCLNPGTTWGIHIVVASGTLGLLVYAIGRHWITLCTANPMPRASAESVRAHLHPQLLILSGFAGVLTAAMLWSGLVILKLAVITLPLAAMLVPSPAGLRCNRWRVVLDTLVSWTTYHARSLPGLLQSPLGPVSHRQGLTLFAAVMTAIVLVRWVDSPIPRVIDMAWQQHLSTTEQLNARAAGTFERLRYGGLTWGLAFIAIASLPVVIPVILATSFSMPLVLEAASQRDHARSTTNSIATTITDLRRSPDLTERKSIFLGRVVEDGSPVLVPRKVFQEHAHGLGDSGSGKTSLFLCPIIEQLVMQGDCSVIVLDLKADSLELLAALQSVAETVRRERGIEMPLKLLSNQVDRPTFAFNPMKQPFWPHLDLQTRTDILCGATGLTYGTDYGQGFYSSANAANLYHALKIFPHIQTFAELADGIGNVIVTAKKRELNPEIRKAGVHVHEVMKRMAACEALNVTDSTGHAPEVVAQAIDLTEVFREPQLLYFHLSATLAPSCAPEFARLVNYMLLAAATKTQRRHPVFLVIDEFQRMVAANLEYMLQLARSMGVGIILANQSMEDLRKSTTNLIPAIEANCRLRQWFSVSSSDDQERLIHSSGLTVDRAITRSVSTNSEGNRSVSYSEAEKVVPRFTINDVLLTSDHPFRSFLRISRGDGYAQYGGLPVIIESGYHISPEEYKLRRALPWPSLPGMFRPTPSYGMVETENESSPAEQSTDPQWSTEIIGDDSAPLSQADNQSIAELFQEFQQSMPVEKPRQRRNRS